MDSQVAEHFPVVWAALGVIFAGGAGAIALYVNLISKVESILDKGIARLQIHVDDKLDHMERRVERIEDHIFMRNSDPGEE
jgi:hypothetical protein